MRLRILFCVVLAAMLTDAANVNKVRTKRQSRSNLGGCTVSPPGVDDPKTPAKENEMVSITCSTDSVFNVCVIEHVDPMYVNQNSNNNNNINTDEETMCIAKQSENGMSCEDDPRIQFQISSNQCGIKISRSDPDDTGTWEFTVQDYYSTGGRGNSKSVKIYTYNKTLVDFTDDRENTLTRNLEVWYNWDENEEAMRDGSNGYENWRVSCNARGGRPEPTITWMINNNDRKAFGEDLGSVDGDSIFNPSESYVHTYDPEGYIRDKASELDFTVNLEFMNYLRDVHGIDVNPESEQFSFELTCIVDQGDAYGQEELSMTVNVRRVYFSDSFNGWEIFGIVVGAIVAFLLLVALCVGLCCFLTRGVFGFGGQDRRYDDANNPKRRPRTQVPVYSDNPPIIRAKSDYAPSAPPGRTHTTLVGEVKGDPAPTPNTESAPLNPKSQLKPVSVDSGHDSPSSSPSPPTTNFSSTNRTSAQRTSSSSTASSYIKNPKRRPNSQHVASLPPKAPKKNRHSFHQTGQQQLNDSFSDSHYDSQQVRYSSSQVTSSHKQGTVPVQNLGATQKLGGSNHSLHQSQNWGGSNPNLGMVPNLGGSTHNLGTAPKLGGSTHNLGTAQYFGSVHEIPDRQVVENDDESYNDRIKYADLDHKAFMIPKNQVLPPPPREKQEYAELRVSRSRIV